MIRWPRLVLCTSVLLATPASAERPSETEVSFQRAMTVLERAVEAVGGRAALVGLRHVKVHYESTTYGYGQSAAPTSKLDEQALEGRAVIDIANQRTFMATQTQFRGGAEFVSEQVINGTEGFVYMPKRGEVFTLGAFEVSLSQGSHPGVPQRMLPQIMLRDALSKASAVRWLGRSSVHGAVHDLITFVDSAGAQLTLYVNAKTGRVSRLESMGDDLLHGDVPSRIEYAGFRKIDGVSHPHRWTYTVGSTVIEARRAVTLSVNAGDLEPKRFDAPKDATVVDGPRPVLKPVRLADGVYVLHDWTGMGFNYNSLVVVQPEGAVLVEAPLVDALSRGQKPTIAGFAKVPVRNVVVSHHHHDHLGGINTYLDGQTAVFTTADTTPYIERLARVRHKTTGVPKTRKGRITAVTERRQIGEGETALELIPIGPSPHVDQMLLAWLPKSKILFVADLVGTSPTGKLLPPTEGSRYLLETLSDLKLDVKTIVPGHGQPTPYAKLVAHHRMQGATLVR